MEYVKGGLKPSVIAWNLMQIKKKQFKALSLFFIDLTNNTFNTYIPNLQYNT